MRPQVGVAALLLAFGADIVWGALRGHSSFAGGGLFGVGITAIALGIVFAWSAWMTSRHVNEPPAYWQTMQDRRRPQIIRAMFALGCAACIAAIISHALGAAWLAGATVAVGVVTLALAVAFVTGGIRPIKYD